MDLWQAREIADVFGDVFPRWLPSILLSGFFLLFWIAPETVGWRHAGQLEWLVLMEVTGAVLVGYFLSARDEPFGWLFVLPALLTTGLLLWIFVGPLPAIVVPSYLMIRAVSVWRGEEEKEYDLPASIYHAFSLMALAWLAACYLPLPSFGWTLANIPAGMAWEVPWSPRPRVVPYAVPAWGFIYFAMLALAELFEFSLFD